MLIHKGHHFNRWLCGSANIADFLAIVTVVCVTRGLVTVGWENKGTG